MKLEYVEIKNFRSIKNIKIDFHTPCQVLVGINESGKSNILNALAFLDDQQQFDRKNDLRAILPDEDPTQAEESYIRFVFKFEEDESDKLIEVVSPKIFSSEKDPDIVSVDGKTQKISEFYSSCYIGVRTVDIYAEERSFRYRLIDNCNLLDGWKRPSSLCQAEFNVVIDGRKYPLIQCGLIRAADFSGIPPSYLEEADINDLLELFNQPIKETKENLPRAMFWKYDKVNFLPENIRIEEFSANPSSCAPLENMFILAGIDNIKESIGRARQRSYNHFQNYLDGIAKKTTEHFRSVWREYENIEFSLRANANQIVPGIKETNTYDFAQRSDGFKRFVTFLLMVSVNVKTDRIREFLMLIDEPGTGLHPSGARYLRDELINISGKNHVLYSTHSIFMIDNDNIGRHYLVKKEGEITSIESVKESNFTEEEVIYNALGYSVFSVLEERNLIFEGWNDKYLFLVALEGADSDLKEKYKNVGTCHAQGVSTIRFIMPMLELAKRRCLIVSDSDKPAKDQKKKYMQSNGVGDWKTYQDIDPSINAITGEDFIKNNFIAEQVNNILSRYKISGFDESILPDKKDKLSTISNWLKNGRASGEKERNKIIAEVKSLIFKNLKHNDVDYEEYLKLLKGISF